MSFRNFNKRKDKIRKTPKRSNNKIFSFLPFTIIIISKNFSLINDTR